MADLTSARLAKIREMAGINIPRSIAWTLVVEMADEIDRLRAVIRETHAPCVRVQNNYRTEHMVHQPGCKLYEIEP